MIGTFKITHSQFVKQIKISIQIATRINQHEQKKPPHIKFKNQSSRPSQRYESELQPSVRMNDEINNE